MKVLKRNGQLQPFDMDKIALSMERVSDEIRQPLTRGDIKCICELIQTRLSERCQEVVLYTDMHDIAVDALRILGFSNMAKAYDESEKSFVRSI